MVQPSDANSIFKLLQNWTAHSMEKLKLNAQYSQYTLIYIAMNILQDNFTLPEKFSLSNV